MRPLQRRTCAVRQAHVAIRDNSPFEYALQVHQACETMSGIVDESSRSASINATSNSVTGS